MTVTEVYQQELAPHIEELAFYVWRDIKKKLITVLADIEETFKDYKHGAYAVTESWEELDSIVKLYMDYKAYDLTLIQYFELLDMLLDDLKEKHLIYMEW